MIEANTIKDAIVAVVWVCSCITTIGAAVVLLVKPVREKVLGIKREDDGIKCLLRSDMLRIYYHNQKNRTIRQYEYENFILEYKAYKAKGGNSFIDHIKAEVEEWEIVT